MTVLRILWNEMRGLFVDDGALALLMLGVIALVAGVITLALLPPLLGGLVLVVGYLLVLAESLYRFTRHRRP